MKKNNEIASVIKKNIIVLIGICLFAGSLNAQTRRTKNGTLAEKPLVLKLSSPKKSYCFESDGIDLTLELTNVGNNPLTIDKKFLWNYYNVSYFKKGIADGFFWRGASGFNQEYGDYLLLKPKQTYKETQKFLFIREDQTKEDFFDREGRYDIEFSYQVEKFVKDSPEVSSTIYTEKITSDKISFYLKKCRKK